MRAQESALSVRDGVEPPPSISQEQVRRFKLRRRRELTAPEYVEGILGGSRAVLSRAITLVESVLPAHIDLAQQIIEACMPHTGNSIRVGITGVPGVGKSTFIERLGLHLVEGRGEKLAVLAVDPSSAISGGSILGDKTRMERLSTHLNAFIRPSASGGSLGGVTRRTRETILLCEAAGYRNVLVETVGVGQSETAVHSMVDFFLLLMLPGAGDELQGMKRGIMEMADLIAINKADGNNRLRADITKREYESALRLLPPAASGWRPEVVTCSAAENTGIAEIWSLALEYNERACASGYLARRRQEQAWHWMQETIRWSLQDAFWSAEAVRRLLPELEASLRAGRITAFRAASLLLRAFHEDRED